MNRYVLFFVGLGLASAAYEYDSIGNRLKAVENGKTREFSYNKLNQISNAGYAYDAWGNMIKTPDAEYKYDLKNRLIEVEKAECSAFVTFPWCQHGFACKCFGVCQLKMQSGGGSSGVSYSCTYDCGSAGIIHRNNGNTPCAGTALYGL